MLVGLRYLTTAVLLLGFFQATALAAQSNATPHYPVVAHAPIKHQPPTYPPIKYDKPKYEAIAHAAPKYERVPHPATTYKAPHYASSGAAAGSAPAGAPGTTPAGGSNASGLKPPVPNVPSKAPGS